MFTRMILAFVVGLLIQTHVVDAAVPPKAQRLLKQIENLTCELDLGPATVDYTRRPVRPTFKDWITGSTEDGRSVDRRVYLRGIADVARARKDRSAWGRTQAEVAALWDKKFAAALEPVHYDLPADYHAAVNALDHRALSAFAEARNKEHLISTFAVYHRHLVELVAEAADVNAFRAASAERGARELRVRADTPNRAAQIVAHYKGVAPATAPPMPAAIEQSILKDPKVRDFFNTEMQTTRRMFAVADAHAGSKKIGGDITAAVVQRIENNYALLNDGVSPDAITKLRRGLLKLRVGWNPYVNEGTVDPTTARDREDLLYRAHRLPLLGKVILAATVELDDAVPAPIAPVAPTKPAPPAERPVRPLIPLSYVMPSLRFIDLAVEQAEVSSAQLAQSTYEKQYADYLRRMRAYNLDDDYQAAQLALVDAHQQRHNARYAYLMYLAYLRPESFAKPGALSALKGKFTKLMTPRLADPEARPSSGDVEHAVNNVLMISMNRAADEQDPPEALATWARIAFVTVPRTMGAHMDNDYVPAIPRHPAPRLPDVKALEPIAVPGAENEAAPPVGEDSAALGMFPTDAGAGPAGLAEAQVAAEEDASTLRTFPSNADEVGAATERNERVIKNIP